jgi:hypothetical protein
MSIAFAYVLPLHGEDWLKLGSSSDPLRRAREFSPRFFELFDFDRAFLIETESRRDASRLEQALRRTLRLHRAPMPLHVRAEAGGHTEWLRGAYPDLQRAALDLACGGHTLHLPARPWFSRALGRQRAELHAWTSAALRQHLIDPDAGAPAEFPAALAVLLDDVRGAFHHFGWNIAPCLPPALQHWYAGGPAPPDKSFTHG